MKLRKGFRIRSWDASSVVPFSAEALFMVVIAIAHRGRDRQSRGIIIESPTPKS
jgi:hypothetical protein